MVLTAAWHERSTPEVVERYGSEVLVHEIGLPRVRSEARGFAESAVLPGVEALEVGGNDQGEVVLWLAAQRALVSAEVLTGSAEGLRVAESPDLRSRDELWAWVAELISLPVEIVLPSHGPPVLSGGQDEIAAALERPAW